MDVWVWEVYSTVNQFASPSGRDTASPLDLRSPSNGRGGGDDQHDARDAADDEEEDQPRGTINSADDNIDTNAAIAEAAVATCRAAVDGGEQASRELANPSPPGGTLTLSSRTLQTAPDA